MTRPGKKTRKKTRVNAVKIIEKLIKAAITVAVIAVLAVSVKNIFDLRAENRDLKKIEKDLTLEKETLSEELKNVKDKDYIEEQARIQLHMIKPGEIIYILQNEKGKNDKNDKDKEGP